MERRFLPNPSAPGADELRQLLASGRRLGFDVETDVSKTDTGPLVTWQVASDDKAFVVDARRWPLTDAPVRAWLEDSRRQKAAHYGSVFESGVCDREGIVLRGVVDTFVLATLLTSGASHAELTAGGLRGLSLAALVNYMYGVRVDKTLQTSFRVRSEITDAQIEYAASDAIWALRLAETLEAQVERAGLGWVAPLEQAVALVAARMGRVGVPVDPKAWWRICEGAAEKAAVAERQAAQLLGMQENLFGDYSDFMIGSNHQVGRAFEKLGIDLKVPSKTTRDGRPGVEYDLSERALSRLEHKAARSILAYREQKKLIDWTTAPANGRIFPEWLPIGADTGRMAARKPNVMAIPQELTKGIVARDGYVLVAADYGQQELYVAADLSGDQALFEALRSSDPYQSLAERAGVDRQRAKVCFLATAYGVGADTMAAQARISYDEASALRKSLSKAFPVTMSFCSRQRLTSAADAGSGLLSQFGRAKELRCQHRRRLVVMGQLGYGQGGNWMRNTPIQSNAADMTKIALVKAEKPLIALGGEMVLVIHDELLAEVPADRADEASQAIVEAMRAGARATLTGDLLPPVKIGIATSMAQARTAAKQPVV